MHGEVEVALFEDLIVLPEAENRLAAELFVYQIGYLTSPDVLACLCEAVVSAGFRYENCWLLARLQSGIERRQRVDQIPKMLSGQIFNLLHRERSQGCPARRKASHNVHDL